MDRAQWRGPTMTPEQIRRFIRFCNVPLPGHPPEQRRLALRLVMRHLERRIAASWLPDVLYAHGLPQHARAADAILAL